MILTIFILQINLLDKISSQKILRHPQIKWLELKDINIDNSL